MEVGDSFLNLRSNKQKISKTKRFKNRKGKKKKENH